MQAGSRAGPLAKAKPGTRQAAPRHRGDAACCRRWSPAVYLSANPDPPAWLRRALRARPPWSRSPKRPDLISCDDRPTARSSACRRQGEPRHEALDRIQSTLYTLILGHCWRTGAGPAAGHDPAGIWWRRPSARARSTPRDPPAARDLPRAEVQPLLQRPAHQAPWHVYYRCEWCPYFDHCRAEMARTDDISRLRISRATPSGPSRAGAAGAHLADLERLLDDPRGGVLDDCASLAAGPTASASRSGRCVTAVRSTRAPRDHAPGRDVRLVLTVQSEPVSGSSTPSASWPRA